MPVSNSYYSIIAVLDIVLVTFVLYKIFLLIKGTRAIQLLKGLGILLAVTIISQWAGLYTINWLLQKTIGMVFVALPVVFQPELRRALEQLGRGRIFASSSRQLGPEARQRLLGELVAAISQASQTRTGMLLVLVGESKLHEYTETGTGIDGLVSRELLTNIFTPNTPLHDGAVIIDGERVVAAGCLLPLSENREVGRELGTRHRAALGISEVSDAVAIVVSEETGTISVAQEGNLTRYLTEKPLKEMLEVLYSSPEDLNRPWWRKLR